jgi:hypothetical protein
LPADAPPTSRSSGATTGSAWTRSLRSSVAASRPDGRSPVLWGPRANLYEKRLALRRRWRTCRRWRSTTG